MFPRFFLIAVVVVASLSAGAAAQGASNATAENSTEVESCELINSGLSLCSADYDGKSAVVVLDSDHRVAVTLTEAVALNEPRELNRRSFVVDGRTTIRFDVDPVNGVAGVTIDDGEVLYGVPLETSSIIVPGPFTASDAQAAGVGSALGVALTTLYLVARRVYGRVEQPERIA
jgi:hypothetical protein